MPNELQALTGLANEMTAALADLVLAAQEGQANTGEISSTLAEMLELAKAAKDRAAPEAPAPVVHVTVQPAAVTPDTSDFEVTHDYDQRGRLVKSNVRRIAKG